ncbi:MAG TPA: transposase [Anaerolineae bacterium]
MKSNRQNYNQTGTSRHRRSIRLKHYDYAAGGAYFVTLVTSQRDCLFGEIHNGVMSLSLFGEIADRDWRLIPEHFPRAELGAYVVMPNHVHGIIVLKDESVGATPSAGATPWVAPTTTDASTTPDNLTTDAPTTPIVSARAKGPKRGSVGAIIGAYKMSVTRQVQRESNAAGIWQRNYYEHIIRDEAEHNRIQVYIESNIANWALDEENLQRSR